MNVHFPLTLLAVPAASKGNPPAMLSLGAMIEDGRGAQGDFQP